MNEIDPKMQRIKDLGPNIMEKVPWKAIPKDRSLIGRIKWFFQFKRRKQIRIALNRLTGPTPKQVRGFLIDGYCEVEVTP